MPTPTPEEIRRWRDAVGLTQSAVAELLPTDLRTWQRWEAGDRRPPPFLARALRDVERELAIVRK